MSRLIRIFGPDGAGKSTIASSVHETVGGVVVPASKPALWPDASWHRASGDQQGSTDPAYHMETLCRCYQMVGRLLASDQLVIVDSDPHFTLSAKAVMFIEGTNPSTMYAGLATFVRERIPPDASYLNVHVTVGGTPAQRGRVLMERLRQREEKSPLDPQSEALATRLASAYDDLEQIARATPEPCVRVETNERLGPQALADSLVRMIRPTAEPLG